MGSALLRAAHVRRDRAPWVLDDTASASLLAADEAEPLEAVMDAWPGEVHAAVRVAHAVRTRLAEDTAVEGRAAGREAYVLLGAGLDSFAWRHPSAERFAIWEIDHPDTQAWKRSALARAGVREQPNVRFEPVDLVTADLADVRTPPLATWSWMGVTMYLPKTATEAVLRAIASHQSGTTLVVNFNLALEEPDPLTWSVRAETGVSLAGVDEPLTAAYAAEEAETLLRETGFHAVTLLDADAVAARYFHGRDDLGKHHASLIAIATV